MITVELPQYGVRSNSNSSPKNWPPDSARSYRLTKTSQEAPPSELTSTKSHSQYPDTDPLLWGRQPQIFEGNFTRRKWRFCKGGTQQLYCNNCKRPDCKDGNCKTLEGINDWSPIILSGWDETKKG